MKYKNTVKIYDDHVTKKRNDRVLDLYNYLDTIGFDNYPKVIEVNDADIKSELIKESAYHEEISGVSLMKLMASLHKKSLTYKEVSIDKYRNIYDTIKSNSLFLLKYYDEMIDYIENKEVMSPSEYLFVRNYSSLLYVINYSLKEIKTWFKKVIDNNTTRVVVVHNNIDSSHFIKSEKDYIFSFDNYIIDTPIIDLYKYYKKEGFKLNYKMLLYEYENIFKLDDNEKKLLYILISIPSKFKFTKDEYNNTLLVNDFYKKIYSSINIIKDI